MGWGIGHLKEKPKSRLEKQKDDGKPPTTLPPEKLISWVDPENTKLTKDNTFLGNIRKSTFQVREEMLGERCLCMPSE